MTADNRRRSQLVGFWKPSVHPVHIYTYAEFEKQSARFYQNPSQLAGLKLNQTFVVLITPFFLMHYIHFHTFPLIPIVNLQLWSLLWWFCNPRRHNIHSSSSSLSTNWIIHIQYLKDSSHTRRRKQINKYKLNLFWQGRAHFLSSFLSSESWRSVVLIRNLLTSHAIHIFPPSFVFHLTLSSRASYSMAPCLLTSPWSHTPTALPPDAALSVCVPVERFCQ